MKLVRLAFRQSARLGVVCHAAPNSSRHTPAKSLPHLPVSATCHSPCVHLLILNISYFPLTHNVSFLSHCLTSSSSSSYFILHILTHLPFHFTLLLFLLISCFLVSPPEPSLQTFFVHPHFTLPPPCYCSLLPHRATHSHPAAATLTTHTDPQSCLIY